MAPKQDGSIKKIIVEAPAELHHKFKAAVYRDGETIKDVIIEYIELYVKNEKEDRAKEGD